MAERYIRVSRSRFAVRGSPSFVPCVARSCFAVCASRFAVRGSYFVVRGSRSTCASRFSFAVRTWQFVLGGSRLALRGSYFVLRGSRFAVHLRFTFLVRGSHFVVRTRWFAVRTTRFVLRGSRFAVRGPLVLYVSRSRFVVRGSWFVVRGSWFAHRGSYLVAGLAEPRLFISPQGVTWTGNWKIFFYSGLEKSKPRETGKTWHHYIVPQVLQPIKFIRLWTTVCSQSNGQKRRTYVRSLIAWPRPLSPTAVSNDEGIKLCTADGWIDEGWDHVTGTLSKLSGKVFTRSPIIDGFVRSLIIFGLGFAALPFCP